MFETPENDILYSEYRSQPRSDNFYLKYLSDLESIIFETSRNEILSLEVSCHLA